MLKELAETAYGLAKARIDGKPASEEMFPYFMVILPDNEKALVITPWENEDQKVIIYRAMRKHLADKQAVAYMFSSEVWLRETTIEEGWDGVMPSKAPDRIEAVMMDGWTRGGEEYHAIAKITRNADGTRTLEPVEVKEYSKTEGRGANLLMPLEDMPVMRH